jgi:archaellum component FlaC
MAGVPQKLSDGQRNEVVSIVKRRLIVYAWTACTVLVAITGLGLLEIYSRVRSRLEDLVAEQFKEPRIKQVVTDAASTQAKSLLTEQIRPEVESFKSQVAQQSAEFKLVVADVNTLREGIQNQRAALDRINEDVAETKKRIADMGGRNADAEQKLAGLEKAVEQSNQVLSQLQLSANFSSVVLGAQNDDRRAYDQLWTWAEDKSFALREAAARAVQTIMDQHDPAIVVEGHTVTWNEGVDPNKLALPELWQAFRSAPPNMRLGVVEFVWTKRPDLSKRDRLQFLADVLRTDDRLSVIEHAGRYFAQGTGDKIKPIAITAHLRWWNVNAHTIK